jgi:hypothetical protein
VWTAQLGEDLWSVGRSIAQGGSPRLKESTCRVGGPPQGLVCIHMFTCRCRYVFIVDACVHAFAFDAGTCALSLPAMQAHECQGVHQWRVHVIGIMVDMHAHMFDVVAHSPLPST